VPGHVDTADFPPDTLTDSYQSAAEREKVLLAPVSYTRHTGHRAASAHASVIPAPTAHQRQPRALPRRRPVPDTATSSPLPPADNCPITHFLSAAHQALNLPPPRRRKDQLPYLKLLDQRARLACGSIGRLISNPHAGALDYTSEADHLLHSLADLPPDTYRHHPTEQLPPASSLAPCTSTAARRAILSTLHAIHRDLQQMRESLADSPDPAIS
jgi:hypothetical protein